MADIKALARTGRKDEARIALGKLESRLRHDGIKEFEVVLANIKKEYCLENGASVKKTTESAQKKMSEAELLLQKRIICRSKA